LRPPIEAIAFDLWNTLVGCWHPVNPMVRLLEAAREAGSPDPARLVAECTMAGPLAGIEAGVRAIEARLGRPVARGEARARLLALWREACAASRVFDDVEPALRRLRARHRIGLITNTQSFDMRFWSASAARALLEVEVVSWEERLLKPDPQIYRRFAERIGVEPRRILMVGDNRRDDVEGARAAGFQAVRLRRALPSLSHVEEEGVEEVGEDYPLADLDDLETRLAALSGAGPRAAPAHRAALRRRAPAGRRTRR
jgi:putative hydrolase of the HAD superfamily